MAELCRLWSQQLPGSRAFRGSSGSFGDRSRAGSVVPQLAEVAAASGLISFLLRCGSFPDHSGGPWSWGRGAASGTCTGVAVQPCQQLCKHRTPHITVKSALLVASRLDSVVGNRLPTARPSVVASVRLDFELNSACDPLQRAEQGTTSFWRVWQYNFQWAMERDCAFMGIHRNSAFGV